MKRLFGVLRLIAGLLIVIAIVGQFSFSAARTTVNPFNFFGYFTIQSNMIAAVAYFASAYFILRKRAQPQWVIYLRAIATTIMVIVGIVYNTLLSGAGLEGSFNLQWSNDILHVIIPIYALLDWVLFADRKRLPYSRLWLLLIYPLIWLVVILIRGATDGWVPYPFLDPSNGYGSVALYSIAIAAFTVGFGWAVYALARVRVIKP